MASTSSERTVRLAAHAALEKKAVDLVVLDLQGLSGIADFFLVCSAQSGTQLDTMADAIQGALKGAGVRARHREGTAQSGWLLLDYGDVVVHLFTDGPRQFYALERLWGDAPVLSVEGS
ncbi:MAG: ribosome silencing factor [Candidatus Rokubacteria bacterium]|nr:ribosome silencing factor [Candidatus Rokubacteria bacterium]